MQVANRTLLVSGSSSGLGAACALRLLELGANVVGLDRSEPGDWLMRRISAEGCTNDNLQARYWHGQADVTDEASVQRVVMQGIERFGEFSGAVCCAGILHGQRILPRDGIASLDAFRKVIDVNLIGTFNVVRYAAESIARGEPQAPDGERGVVVMTSSIAAFDGQVGQCAYSASKGAIAAMTLPMAREFAKLGIRVVSIAPGVFETPMMQAASQKVREPLLEASVFPRRFGDSEEFAAMVQCVLENAMLNGAVLRLDGALRM
ncbi:MAG: SDR family NAD(P)-dependent oxidoreductase [Planctomycetota bacterium]|nr:SDR family NAD(P)-dependent oxidoreductase [Planctomycetota bacterium]